MFNLSSVVSLSKILQGFEGRKLKIKTQHMLVVWKVLAAAIANLEIQINVVVAS
jgi:hypothetical protein